MIARVVEVVLIIGEYCLHQVEKENFNPLLACRNFPFESKGHL